MDLSSLSMVSWIAIIVLAVSAINGLRLGMVRTVFSTFTFIIALIIAAAFSPKLNTTLQESALYKVINERIEETMAGNPSLTEENPDQNSVIEGLPLPEFIRDALAENNDENVYSVLGVDTFRHYISAYISRLILRVLSFLLVFIAAIIILRLLCSVLDAVAGLPVLHTLNKAGGLLFGFINGMILLWIFCSIAALFAGTPAGAELNKQIGESAVLNMIYQKNLLLSLAAGLKKSGLIESLQGLRLPIH